MIGGQDVEVIVVDDGSTDKTAEIAREYCQRYPGIVRLVQKENGGHGSAVNKGLETATGKYFKVVDSDDWLNADAYMQIIEALKNIDADLFISNYVYEYAYNGTRNYVRYRNIFPQHEIITWDQMQRGRVSQMLLMHSLIYRTELLRECGLKLPEHTFYVDNLVAYLPLPYVKSMYYIDCDLYRYYIGRVGQSVDTQTMIRNIDQQIKVTKIMIEAYDIFNDIKSKYLRRHMLHYLSMMVAITVVHLSVADDAALNSKVEELWDYIRQYDETLYFAIRRSFINQCIDFARKTGGKNAAKTGLKVCKRIYKFS